MAPNNDDNAMFSYVSGNIKMLAAQMNIDNLNVRVSRSLESRGIHVELQREGYKLQAFDVDSSRNMDFILDKHVKPALLKLMPDSQGKAEGPAPMPGDPNHCAVCAAVDAHNARVERVAEEELRMQCLQEAFKIGGITDAPQAIDIATQFYNFIKGKEKEDGTEPNKA